MVTSNTLKFTPTEIPDVVLITPERFEDERGYFVKTWGLDDFDAYGLDRMVARNMSFNRQQGTLRGMHFQHPPHTEAKLISAVAGAIYDVALDLRPDSESFGAWVGRELRADSGAMLYVPQGFAHGFITLEPNTITEYLISEFYAPQAASGVRWDDPAFGIEWPIEPIVVSERDRSWPEYSATTTSVAR
jgi:dTDP-4-dehydrorhamnose 3,5-epimerase